MKKNGNVNVSDLKNFKNKIENTLGASQIDLFVESCAKELAARLLAKVIKRTPVGQYPKSSGKKGGTLRRGWTGNKNQSGTAYANSLSVRRMGSAYIIEIVNPIEYAPYVEFGHRTRDGNGWVEGHFMLTISEREIQTDAPRVLENKLKKKLRECFK